LRGWRKVLRCRFRMGRSAEAPCMQKSGMTPATRMRSITRRGRLANRSASPKASTFCAGQRLGRPADALESFDRALALRPDLASAHGNRAGVLVELGRPGDALTSFDRA